LVAIHGKKGADVNQEREYGIMPSLLPFSSIQEVEICQKMAFRLVHTVKQKEPAATSILEICLEESLFTDLLRDAYPDADLFLLKIDNDFVNQYSIPDQFDIIMVSPSCQKHPCVEDLISFCHSKLKQGGLFASILLGPDTFLELSTCITWMEQQQDCESLIDSFSASLWEQKLHQVGLSMWQSKEEWFRESCKNSQELFQIAATLGFFQTKNTVQTPEMVRFFREWMKTYQRGFRTKDDRISVTYHFIERVGYFL
jgi:hypothetical protein